MVRSRTEGFGAEVRRRILAGTYVLSHGYYDAYYLQAQRLRRRIADGFQVWNEPPVRQRAALATTQAALTWLDTIDGGKDHDPTI